MRALSLLPLALLSALPLTAQTQNPASIKDAKALLAVALPSYDFSSPSLKPWHMKASYQIFDQNGNPSERGTYEYWWVSPSVDRSSWTRGAVTQSEWHTANGKRFETSSGGTLHLFETRFPKELFAPLPVAGDDELKQNWLQRDNLAFGDIKLPCVKILTNRVELQSPSFPSLSPLNNVVAMYCFDPKSPILLLKSLNDGVTERYGSYVGVQDRDLPRTFEQSVNDRKILTATVVALGALDPTDPALVPPSDAKSDSALPAEVAAHVMNRQRVKEPNPQYPERAKQDRLSGTVMLEAVIGKDGKTHDVQVISTPSPILTDPSLQAVNKWEYKPYLLNGEPVDVRTTIYVTFAAQH